MDSISDRVLSPLDKFSVNPYSIRDKPCRRGQLAIPIVTENNGIRANPWIRWEGDELCTDWLNNPYWPGWIKFEGMRWKALWLRFHPVTIRISTSLSCCPSSDDWSGDGVEQSSFGSIPLDPLEIDGYRLKPWPELWDGDSKGGFHYLVPLIERADFTTCLTKHRNQDSTVRPFFLDPLIASTSIDPPAAVGRLKPSVLLFLIFFVRCQGGWAAKYSARGRGQ